jgi:hypothetical protein
MSEDAEARKQEIRSLVLQPREEDFLDVPNTNLSIAKDLITDTKREPVVVANWFQAKETAKALDTGFDLPTLSTLMKAKKSLPLSPLESGDPAVVIGGEWTDSAVAWPDEYGRYSPRIRIPGVREGEHPILIEHSKLREDPKFPGLFKDVLVDGVVTELPNLPRYEGYVEEFDEKTGLPIKLHSLISKGQQGLFISYNPNLPRDSYQEELCTGLRAVALGRKNNVISLAWPTWILFTYLGFRVNRAKKLSGY